MRLKSTDWIRVLPSATQEDAAPFSSQWHAIEMHFQSVGTSQKSMLPRVQGGTACLLSKCNPGLCLWQPQHRRDAAQILLGFKSQRQGVSWIPGKLPGGAVPLIQLHGVLCALAQQVPQDSLVQVAIERHAYA